MAASASLGSSTEPLDQRYDLAMLDLDGVVYIGSDAVPGAPEHVAAARAAGMRVAFITNNASRPPEAVAEHLRELGVEAGPDDVVTSAQAAGRVLSERLGAGARVVVLGGQGLADAVAEAGLVQVGVEDDAEAVVTGYGPDVLWGQIMRAAVRIQDGLWWVASNTDLTFPTTFGVAPGHGVLVETLRRFTRRRASGRRQAGPAAPRRDGAPVRWRAAADGRRPARHRHRGCARGRGRLAAGDDGRDRAGRAGGGRARAAPDVHLDRPGRARCAPATARGVRGRGVAGRLARRG